ncbi:hypothetical protein KI387_019281 [Taxus chinensis]|uniref:Glycosyltransferase 61 catalytic domain-containing protein n=1 Tax=Taxus chinensis TaxID=29808 RepID=A0AA38LE11_TAXCH|nr:hypothetical protein KI387_019281 [Taxus chinensis]
MQLRSKMKKRRANPSPKNRQMTQFQPSFSAGRMIQLLLLCVIFLVVYGVIQFHWWLGNHGLLIPVSSPNKIEQHSELQLHFLRRADSLLAQVYHEERFPALNGTDQKLRAVTISGYCRGKTGKSESRPKHAIFRDAVLAERKLYVPSTINCSTLPRDVYLGTKFNPGQGSTPKIDIMVVPWADTFEDFQPHVSCGERVYEPSVFFSFINWPQYGHAMFNGISLLWEIFRGPLSTAGKNVRLYAYGDSIVSHQRQEAQEVLPFFDVKTLRPLMSMFSYQPVRSLANLLMQSDRHPVCFSYVLLGLSGADLDHYNFHAPLKQWREFAQDVKVHFNVRDPPRTSNGVLQRVAPLDAVGKINPDTELGEVKAISWKELPGRPRLTIVDRRSNRVIVNVKELDQIAVKSGFFKSVEVAYLEGMNLQEQVELMGKSDVLVGMDGTGMMNAIFMPEGGVVVHIRPYGCKEYLPGKGINFNRLWSANPGRVIRHESEDRQTTRFPTNIAELPERVFNRSSNSSTSYRFSFILKQDTLVDPPAFRCILDTAHKLLHGIPVNWNVHLACTRSVFS